MNRADRDLPYDVSQALKSAEQASAAKQPTVADWAKDVRRRGARQRRLQVAGGATACALVLGVGYGVLAGFLGDGEDALTVAGQPTPPTFPSGKSTPTPMLSSTPSALPRTPSPVAVPRSTTRLVLEPSLRPSSATTSRASSPAAKGQKVVLRNDTAGRVTAFCGDCPPDGFSLSPGSEASFVLVRSEYVRFERPPGDPTCVLFASPASGSTPQPPRRVLVSQAGACTEREMGKGSG